MNECQILKRKNESINQMFKERNEFIKPVFF